MFENLRRAFREAVENFNRELNRDAVPETVDRLLHGMKEEAADTRAAITRLEEELEKTRKQVAAEEAEVRTCLRREEMARKIDDDETADVAAEFARKHERRRQVLQDKAEALGQELEMRKAEFTEMMERIREAGERRDELSATAGRAGARETIGGSEDLFAELDRMAEKIGADDDEAQAWSELSDIGPELGIDLDEPGPSSRRPNEAEVDAALEELKRRMGEE